VNSLREVDIEIMRRLSPRANVIPVIGKADALTPTELKDFKQRVFAFWHVYFYDFPYDPEEDDEETIAENII